MHISILLEWIILLFQRIVAHARERREYTTISKKNKTKVVVGTCEINCVKKEGTEQWNENILNETNSISNTCSLKY